MIEVLNTVGQFLLTNIFAQVAVAVVVVGVTLKKVAQTKRKEKLEKLQAKWDAAGKDVVVLHMFPRAIYCPNPSPYPVKLETWLRMNNVK